MYKQKIISFINMSDILIINYHYFTSRDRCYASRIIYSFINNFTKKTFKNLNKI